MMSNGGCAIPGWSGVESLARGQRVDKNMSQPSGMKTVGPCPYCGKRYLLTNYMSRESLNLRDDNGRRLKDTHLIACYRKYMDKPQSSAATLRKLKNKPPTLPL